ncbi:MFS general substrate transporter [Dentipellis sp. KUC8613]|nr:MFS general substrate transporter [Dentipellis sp. KUC8613]
MPETVHSDTVTSALSASHNLDPNSSRLYSHASSSKVSLHKVDNEDGIELAKLPQAETLSSKDPDPTIEVEAASESGHASATADKGTHRLLANIQFFSLCYTLFLAGWNDGTTGPLLPRIQSVYHVGFTVVSLVFISNCVGFVIGSVSNIWLTDKLGFGKAIVLGSASQAVAYCLQAPAPPFPLFVIAYSINGFGMAIQDAQANGYVASYKENAAAKMGILHATYGAGALAAPLVATQFAQLHHWSFHYLASLGVALSNALILAAVFRFKRQDECLAQIGQSAGEQGTSEDSKYRQIFRLKELHLLAFFIFVYVGVEVTLGGWIVTYVRQVRGGGASSGYISAGFFGGLMVGRVALLWVNKAVGERLVIFFYVLLAIGLELVIWFVPSLIGGAVAVSIVGVLLGPVYPIVMNESSRILPRWLLTGCIGWIAGFGQTGSAILPFMTGAIASRAGIKSLQPVLVSMMGLLVVLWALVPRGHSRAD